MSDSRVIFRKHSPYATRKNKFKTIKTPGKKLNILYIKKKISKIKCGDQKTILNGIQTPKSLNFVNLCKRKKKISRIYGGCLSGKSVKERITKAFLLEEKKIVKKFMTPKYKKTKK
ncbi:60S ribosomal protein L34 (nucleomorph) [Chroomonas mesostigmatica CCMP1168]|uniref:60S ribosomal protein L34 n=1 Tax=Chroomonas mesostigmatica CCMP1168 TaxID=1195612 RepID=J7G1H3_9CRYP|nr:60S ribosomal protein L34 [Chroomonas mesostigmatica CCMP1168]|mmetsp:Transcript_65909/g.162231  ORF Transcript_65909/g.162231 Transcript_65909/m.162231 type:complete len:116 (+) Transcript_65909:37-384(+)